MLNLHQLQLFKVVVESGGYTAASEKLHISQPSVSIQVKRLENEVNHALLERIGNRVFLTDAGEELYMYACKIINLAEEASQSLAQRHQLKGGKIKIGASTTPGNYLLPTIAAEFRSRFPEIEVNVEISNTRIIEEKVCSNEIDLAILGEEQRYDASLHIEPFIYDQLVFVCGSNNELIQLNEMDVSTFIKQRLVLREKGSSTRDFVEQLIIDKGYTFPDTIWELPSTESIKKVLMGNWGASILSYLTIRTEVEAGLLHILPFHEKIEVQRNINLAYRRTKIFSPALLQFINTLRESRNQFSYPGYN